MRRRDLLTLNNVNFTADCGRFFASVAFVFKKCYRRLLIIDSFTLTVLEVARVFYFSLKGNASRNAVVFVLYGFNHFFIDLFVNLYEILRQLFKAKFKGLLWGAYMEKLLITFEEIKLRPHKNINKRFSDEIKKKRTQLN